MTAALRLWNQKSLHGVAEPDILLRVTGGVNSCDMYPDIHITTVQMNPLTQEPKAQNVYTCKGTTCFHPRIQVTKSYCQYTFSK